MAEIAVVRVDSRLIHGQVLTRFVNAVNANRIIIIDSELANDPYLVSIFKMSTPPGTGLEVYDAAEAADIYRQDCFGEGRVIVLFKNLEQVQQAYANGFTFKQLQLAGLGSGPGRKLIHRTVSVTEQGAQTLKMLCDNGVEVYFQSLPDEQPEDAFSALAEQFPELF